jgi:tetratricopeptide (TPR) repeat protein
MSTEEVVAETKMDVEEGHEFVPTSEQAKSDANDYSRFKDIEDSDDEPENKAEGDAGEQLSIDDAITRAISSKEAGNNAFKGGNNAEAKTMYTDGLTALGKFKDIQPPIISEAHANEVRNLLISINGNLAMIFLKEENYSLAISNATEVLNRDEFNVKAYYRRGCAKFRLALYAEAKMDLSKCVEIDPNNGAAKKELADVIKTAKEHAKKEKAAFSGMFSKGSMYDDKEKERKEKIRQKELEEERLRDEWSKSKLERRAEGLPEQTYDEWKKEQAHV